MGNNRLLAPPVDIDRPRVSDGGVSTCDFAGEGSHEPKLNLGLKSFVETKSTAGLNREVSILHREILFHKVPFL